MEVLLKTPERKLWKVTTRLEFSKDLFRIVTNFFV